MTMMSSGAMMTESPAKPDQEGLAFVFKDVFVQH